MTIFDNVTMSKYLSWHNSIVARALSENRKKVPGGTYYENHHIIPKKLGGSNGRENRVLLTAKEHFIVHLCLCRIFKRGDPEIKRVVYAAMKSMTWKSRNHEGRTITSGQFAMARRLHAEAMSEIQRARPPRTFSEEHKAKLGASIKASYAIQRENGVGRYKDFTPNENRPKRARRQGPHLPGKPHTWASSCKNPNRTFATCTKCGRSTLPHLIKRWHNENCRSYQI